MTEQVTLICGGKFVITYASDNFRNDYLIVVRQMTNNYEKLTDFYIN
jgi:hypothetical protein